MQSDIQEKLLNFICENFFVERDEIDINRSLVETGIIDSIGLIEISAFMEKFFSIKVEEEDITRENFGSVVKMVKFLEKRIELSEKQHNNSIRGDSFDQGITAAPCEES